MIDDDNYIQRQTAFLFDKGLSPDVARQLLIDRLGSSYKQQESESGKGGGPIVLALIEALKGMNIGNELIFMAVQKLKQDAVDLARPVNKYFSGVIGSIAGVIVIMLFLMLLVSTRLFPIFNETFTSFGNELPALTRLVFDTSLIYLMVLVPLAILAFLVLTSKALKEFYRLKISLPAWMLHVPALKSVAETLYLWTYLEMVTLLSRLGSDQDDHISRARKVLETNRGELPAAVAAKVAYIGKCLDDARALGTLEAELDFWLAKLSADQSASLLMAREQLMNVINAILGVIVGLLMVALYLPIFQIGAVI